MKFLRNAAVLEFPHTAVTLLLAVNILVYAITLQRSGAGVPSGEVLFRSGAMYGGALQRHEYWRLVAYAFMHGNMLHLVTNMFCLVLWGGPLEKRVGPLYFLLIYFGAVIAGAVLGTWTHSRPYLTVGASGGISGILGALLCLRILARINLSAMFFVSNIGLNIVLSLSSPRVDWGAHLGGFVAGMVVCALLDAVELAGPRLMRCRFPEFIKLNLALLFAVPGLFVGSGWVPAFPASEWVVPLVVVFVMVGIVKGIDIALSRTRGLALTVMLLAVANAAVAGVAVTLLVPASGCGAVTPSGMVPWAAASLASLLQIMCTYPAMTGALVVVAVFELTQLVYLPELRRGRKDMGFIAAAFRGDRARRRGL